MPRDPDVPAVSIDVNLVRRLIAGQFPQWAGLPLRAVMPGGSDNFTFRLGEHMSVRLPSAAAYVAQVDKEHRWLPHLAPHLPVPIPVPLAQGAPLEGDYPWPWSIYGWLDGEPATAELIDDPMAFARSLAGFLDALHRIDARDGPPAGRHSFHRGGRLSVYDAQTRTALSAVAGRIDMAAAEEIWTAALSSQWRGSPLWVHGDMARGNLLVKDGALYAVIDFGCLAVGDPACDLVVAWTLLSGASREAFRAALPLDGDTWSRARGWALWKALVTVTGENRNQRETGQAWQVIEEVLAGHCKSRRA